MKQILKKTKRFLQKASEKDSVMLIFSVLFAVMLWSYIVNREYPDARQIISGVQIDYEASISGTPAEAEGYRIYDADVSDIEILVVANRTKLGDLDKNMFYAKVSADNYNGEQPVSGNTGGSPPHGRGGSPAEGNLRRALRGIPGCRQNHRHPR